MDTNAAVDEIKKYFVHYPDFPKKGINFWDFFSIFKNKRAYELFNIILTDYADRMRDKVDVVVGIESKGFLFGPVLANLLGCIFVPIRKKGKLPGKVERIAYTIEYGEDVMEIQTESIQSGQRVIIVDDVLATGGTLSAASELVDKLGGKMVDCVVFYCIPEISERNKISSSVTILCK